MLRAHHDGVDADGTMRLAVILDSHLALGVGTKVAHQLALAADLRQFVHDEVRQVKRQRHVRLGLVAGIAEHHALVARTLFLGICALHATVDVAALLVQRTEHATGRAVKHQLAAVIANLVDDIASRLHQVDVCLTFHLAGDNHLAGSDKRLAGNLRLRVVGEELVQDGVTNLVGNLVGMPFRYRFRCE